MTPAPRIDLPALIDSRPVGALQFTVAALCAGVMLLDGLNTQVIGYLGPALAKDWHLSRAVLAPIFSAGLAGLMVGLLAIGPISDKLGRKPAMILSVLLFGFFTLLTAAARGVDDLLIYRVIAGIGLGGAMPNALALTGEYCPTRRRATLVVVMFCGFSLGSILGGGLTATLITRYGWRAIFLIGGFLPLALAPILAAALPESLYLSRASPTGRLGLRSSLVGSTRAPVFPLTRGLSLRPSMRPACLSLTCFPAGAQQAPSSFGSCSS